MVGAARVRRARVWDWVAGYAGIARHQGGRAQYADHAARARHSPRRCVLPSVDLECGTLVWVAASQMGDSEVRGAGGGKGVLTAGVTGYNYVGWVGVREWDVEGRMGEHSEVRARRWAVGRGSLLTWSPMTRSYAFRGPWFFSFFCPRFRELYLKRRLHLSGPTRPPFWATRR